MRGTGVALALLAAAVGAGAARADAPRVGGIAMNVVGACPEGAALRGLVDQLVPSADARSVAVSVEDRGREYRIAVGDDVTTLDDPARDCAARTREAAVVVAGALRAHPEVFGPPRWTVEKGFVFDFASQAGKVIWAPGAEFRGAYGRGLWSLVGAAGARGPVTLSFDDGSKAELLRFPFDAGARLTAHRWRLRPWVVVGASLTLNGFLGQNLVDTERQWRVDPGALALVGATLPLRGRIGVAAAINVRWQPRPYHLQVAPLGTVGDTPTWWLGISLNYTLDAKPSSS